MGHADQKRMMLTRVIKGEEGEKIDRESSAVEILLTGGGEASLDGAMLDGFVCGSGPGSLASETGRMANQCVANERAKIQTRYP